MKKIIGGVLAAAALFLAIFLGFVASQPSQMHIERSARMNATADDVYPLISDLRAFTTWDPWSGMDPDQTMTFGEPTSGVGAWYTWEGDETGAGKMTVTAAEPPTRVVMSLQFIRPFESTATATTSVAPDGDGVVVTWAFDSENGFVSKLFGVFVDMDAMLGADFEKGLTALKPLAEAAATARQQAEAAAKAEAEAAAKAEAEAAAQAALGVTP